ncbi:glycogen synthase GlgA [Paenibacillus sp. GCM10023252]|uniref:glycogen synthase GlgA n=1 Tax=Paenibacillus sp. GCM10023252 TaxID=3252649 RepID=UPI003611D68E
MNILFAASEAVPLAKTGGLADVTGALPKMLNSKDTEVRVILPNYAEVPAHLLGRFERVAEYTVAFGGWRNPYCGLLKAELDGVIYYLIDNEWYFGRKGLYGYGDDAERFVFFCYAVMEGLSRMDFSPDIIHCHDWQTGLIPFLLKTRYAAEPDYASIQTVFTVHNLQYQGLFPIELLKELTGAGDEEFSHERLEYFGSASCLKGGLVYADKLTTVSETYAAEIQQEQYGEGLHGLLRSRSCDLIGIRNGIDVSLYDPMNDDALHTPYRSSIGRKRKNKLALQRELGLPESESTPLFAMVTRLVEHKGFSLLESIADEWLADDVQLVVLGVGESRYENLLHHLASRYPDKVAARFEFSDQLARRIYAGSDLYLMPSKHEPCGLSQLLALRYGSVPIVRETGGLKDTVQPYDEYIGVGNGFTFPGYDAAELLRTIRGALALYYKEDVWKRIVNNAAKEDLGWNRSARAYLTLYTQLLTHRKGKPLWPVI